MSDPLLEIRDLKVHFPIKQGIFNHTKKYVKAVNGLNLSVNKGETLGIVGESGSGKSTLARTIIGLTKPTSGDILFEGKSMSTNNPKQMRELRRNIQMIYQDPYTSLNPRMKVGEIIAAPLKAYKIMENLENRVKELMEMVGLRPEDYEKLPHQFSGGQRQRIGIARAIALKPKLIICDEPVSALDVSIQAQVINLLEDLRKELNLTYVFIAHDLSVIKHIADKVGVMYLGKMMEQTDNESFYNNAQHPYSQALLSAIPLPDPVEERKRERIVLKGELPSPANPPTGCVFQTRCPFVQNYCKGNHPPMEKMLDSDHYVSCFFPVEQQRIQQNLIVSNRQG